MSFRKSLALSGIVLSLVAGTQAFGQQTLKVAVLNSQRAFETSIEGKKTALQLQDRNAKIKADLSRMDNEIKQLQAKLGTQRMSLSATALLDLQNDIDKRTTAQTRYKEDSAREVQKLQYDIVQRVRGEMAGILDAVARERGFDLVLDLSASGVVFFNKSIDITDEIIKRYDESKAAPAKK